MLDAPAASSSIVKRSLPVDAAAMVDEEQKEGPADKEARIEQEPVIFDCPICLESFNMADLKEQSSIRVLPCGDMICDADVTQLLRLRDADSTTIECPQCHAKHDTKPGKQAASASFSSLDAYVRSLNRQHQILKLTTFAQPAAVSSPHVAAASSSTAAVVRAPLEIVQWCSTPGCSNAATLICRSECGLLCGSCEQKLHPAALKPKHHCITLLEQTQKKQQAHTTAVKKYTEKYQQHVDAINALKQTMIKEGAGE